VQVGEAKPHKDIHLVFLEGDIKEDKGIKAANFL
jgi:hypothetical protein